MSLDFGKVLEKSNGRMKSYKAKSVILANLGLFRGFFTTFGPLGRIEFCHKNFYSAQLDMKIQLGAKVQEKVMEGYPAIVRTHGRMDGRTHATENNSPSPINRGTKIHCMPILDT